MPILMLVPCRTQYSCVALIVIGNLDIIRQLILPQIAALRLMLNIGIVFVHY